MNSFTEKLHDINIAALLALANDCGHAFQTTGDIHYCLISRFAETICDDQISNHLTQQIEPPSALIGILHGGEVIELLDQLMAMEGLLPDPHLDCGGFIEWHSNKTKLTIPTDNKRYGLNHYLTFLINLGNSNMILSFDNHEIEEYGNPTTASLLQPGDALLLKQCRGAEVNLRLNKSDSLTDQVHYYPALVTHYYAQAK